MTNRQQSAFFLAIVFLFTSGIGLVIYRQYDLYYQQKTAVDMETASTAIPVKKTQSSLIPTEKMKTDPVLNTNVIEGWKTYKNTRYGFEVSYPSDWEADTQTIDSISDMDIGFQTLATHFDLYPKDNKVSDGFVKKVEFYLNRSATGTTDEAKNKVGNFISIQQLGIYNWAEGAATDGPGSGSINFELIDGNFGVHVNVWELNSEESLITKILSTFRFSK